MKRLQSVFLFLLVACLGGAGCGDEPTPTEPEPIVVAFSEFYTDVIPASATKFYSFGLVQDGTVQVTLASLTAATGGAIVNASPTLGFGIPSGTGCGVTTTVNMAPALTAQITQTLKAGIYCVRITGDGGISADTNFAIRITQGTLTNKSTASPVTFASNLGPKGASVQTFTVAGGTTGIATVTLDTVSPSTTIGVGLGLWRPDTAVCNMTQAINTNAGG